MLKLIPQPQKIEKISDKSHFHAPVPAGHILAGGSTREL